MTNKLALALALAVPLLIAGTASAQVASPPPAVATDPDATSVDDVTVVGATTHRDLETYARTVVSGPMGRLSPRWNDRICVNIVNMDEPHAALLRDRIGVVAKAIGLRPLPPGCPANISIYASDEPDALAESLVAAAPRGFRPARLGVSLGDAALETFRTSDAPVRWWHVSLPLMVDTGQLAIAVTDADSNPMSRSVAVRNGSRLRGNVRDDMVGVTIIVDTKKLNGAPFSALSDYLAFIALAPADPRVETQGFDTVLNLFDQPGVPGLSLMDEDYLFALYSSSRDPATPGIQAAEIADRMASEQRRRSRAQK